MAEVESHDLVNRASKPLREVCEIDAALSISILHLQQLLQVHILNRLIGAKVVKEVLNSDEAIEVPVKGKESFPDLLVVVCDFVLDFSVKLSNAIGHQIVLLGLISRVLPGHLDSVPILIALVLLIQNVQMREENLFELVKGHAVLGHSVL